MKDDEYVREEVEDLFRRESAHLVSALVRVLGPSNIALVEDVVQDALISALHAWRFGLPDHPKAWILQVAKNRAIDVLRRDRRLAFVRDDDDDHHHHHDDAVVTMALSAEADAQNQLAMMFAICDESLSSETHVTLILKLLCGLSSAEIARAYLIDAETINRRLQRGRARLAEVGVAAENTERAHSGASVEQALYLLFNEGYHGSDPDNPLHPVMCADAIRLVELLLLDARSKQKWMASAEDAGRVHALAALFCLNGARLNARVDDDGVILPFAEQDRARWNQALIARGIEHLGASASGDHFTRWHLEAGIAFEHTRAASVAETNWERIVEYYDALINLAPGPVVAMNRALALSQARGLEAGREALTSLASEPKLAEYSFYWAARADIERRAERPSEAKALYRKAITLAKSRAERVSYERRVKSLEN